MKIQCFLLILRASINKNTKEKIKVLVVAPFSCSLSFCFSINCYNLYKADGPEPFALKALLGALSGGTWTKEG